MSSVIDSHQHFWQLDRGDYGWLTPDLEPLYRDFAPEDLAPLLEARGIGGTILVQAAPTVDETRFLLELAAQTPWVLGVVGWVDMAADDVAEQLEALALDERFVGIRPMLQDLDDPAWMLRPELDRAYRALINLGLTFDALVQPRHLEPLHTLLDRYPALPVVIDHGAKPDIAGGAFEPWAGAMAQIADASAARCKLSGLVTEAAEQWQAGDIRPYMDHLLDAFGAGRLLWGSDWPVVNTAGGYDGWWDLTQAWLADQPEAIRAQLMHHTARDFYLTRSA